VAVKKPVGTITRGTTNPNRLRRVDRFIAALPLLRQTESPLVVDLGYGASPITAVELLSRLLRVNPRTRVLGIEIDRERVERGLAVAHDQLQFALGGFEVPVPAAIAAPGAKVDLIRAFNVLRQYDESEVAAAWSLMQSRLAAGGLIVEGTCDEIGRLASWVTLDSTRPQSLTLSVRVGSLDTPSTVAERLPKVLIHHNLPGERINSFLNAMDAAWRQNAGLSTFGAVQRWVATCEAVAKDWLIVGDRKRFKLGEISVDWSQVRPD
jgi:hypothetical protein